MIARLQKIVVCPKCGRRHLLEHGDILVQCECGYAALPETVKRNKPIANRNYAIRK